MLTTNFHGAVANLIAVSGDGERVQAQRHPRSFRSLRKETCTKLADNSYKTTQTCNTRTDGRTAAYLFVQGQGGQQQQHRQRLHAHEDDVVRESPTRRPKFSHMEVIRQPGFEVFGAPLVRELRRGL